MPVSPRVSVIIPAFNLATYLPAAIDSALAQHPPGGSVQVIVVDDGSTDETPQVLDVYGDRVEVIRQANGGLVAAVDRGLRAVRGDYVALLDADDEWPPDRLRRHVAILERNPRLGLVHGDMELIDAEGVTTHPSFFARQSLTPPDGRVLGPLLSQNFVSGGASTFRAALMPAFWPIPAEAAYPDWWIATAIACVAEIAHERGIANRYRSHGANMGLDADLESVRAIYRHELPWRRWMMLHLVDDDTVTVADLDAALRVWRHAVVSAAVNHSGSARDLMDVGPVSPDITPRPMSGPHVSKMLMRALSRDPFDGASSVDLEIALAREAAIPVTPSPPLVAVRARAELTIARLDEVLRCPGLVTAYAGETMASGDATLLVLALPQADLSPLVDLVASEPLLCDERCDIQVINEPATPPARRLLTAMASAYLGVTEPCGTFAGLPLHGAADRFGATSAAGR